MNLPTSTVRPDLGPDQLMAASRTIIAPAAIADWRAGLPTLACAGFTLRELSRADAASLLAMLSADEVARFISAPPSTVLGFERFIAWTRGQRQAGENACLAIVPDGLEVAVGLFQIRLLEPGSRTAEWGFGLGSPYWGNGFFAAGAARVLDFAFDVMGLHRLEARAAVANGRGNAALRKIGAVQDVTLRRSFRRHGRSHDQILWSILADDWRLIRSAVEKGPFVH
jgi:RimJ/RimL family protein N-acetyltransferase